MGRDRRDDRSDAGSRRSARTPPPPAPAAFEWSPSYAGGFGNRRPHSVREGPQAQREIARERGQMPPPEPEQERPRRPTAGMRKPEQVPRAVTPSPVSAAAGRGPLMQRSLTPPATMPSRGGGYGNSMGYEQSSPSRTPRSARSRHQDAENTTPELYDRPHITSIRSHARRGKKAWDDSEPSYAGCASERVNMLGESVMTSSAIQERLIQESPFKNWEEEQKKKYCSTIGAGQSRDEALSRRLHRGKLRRNDIPPQQSVSGKIIFNQKGSGQTSARQKWASELGDAAGVMCGWECDADDGQPSPATTKKTSAHYTRVKGPYPQQELEANDPQQLGFAGTKKKIANCRAALSLVDEVFNNPMGGDSEAAYQDWMATSAKGAAGFCDHSLHHMVRGKKMVPQPQFGPYNLGNVPDDELRLEEEAAFVEAMEGKTNINAGEVGTRMLVKVKKQTAIRRRVLPTLFISHGPGAMPLFWDPSLPVMRNMGRLLEFSGVTRDMLKGIVVISSHWEKSTRPGIDVEIMHSKGPQRLLYDYVGAPPEHYKTHTYAPYGSPELSHRLEELLMKANFKVAFEKDRYIDSGAWIPLVQFPEEFEDVPIVQISLPGVRQISKDTDGSEIARMSLEMGYCLRELRREGVLIIGSGNVVSCDLDKDSIERWIGGLKRLCCKAPNNERAKLLEHWQELPHARMAQPRDEKNLLPLHVVAGAAHGEPGRCLGDYRLGRTGMTHFLFGDPA
eukprot:TRINITY_DN112920_c0_g1_i1.p1 TRINITY_DN112920_c0_g1~~TRINITY_DN112920_c0_g1_i1.p1  ORF type:complete len:734 (+),score=167.82 TRINITY_DN112920_c0_g1_i1:44-2245(+)